MFIRRLGPDPHLDGAQSPALKGCPDIFELETGDFAIIGKDITRKAIGQLPPGASCGPDEIIVVIPRKTLVAAKPDIPDNQYVNGGALRLSLDLINASPQR